MSLLGKKILSAFHQSGDARRDKRGTLKTFDNAKKVGVLFTWESKKKEEVVDEFVKTIEEGREVDVLCYNSSKDPISANYPTVGMSDLSVLGKINSKNANNFISKPFDYLFHLDFEPSVITRALLIKSKSLCRVGVHQADDEHLYELMIGINKSAGLTNLSDQMLKYVNVLR